MSGEGSSGSRDLNGRRTSNGIEDSRTGARQASFKRQRTALACKSCRVRKTRCDGSRPQCTMCIEMGLECVYQQPAGAPYRNSVSSSAVQDRLDMIEETLHQLVEEKRGLHKGEAVPARLSSQQPQHTIHVNLDPQRNGGDISNDLNPREDMQAPTSFEDTVDGMAAITFSDETESGFFGPTSNIAFIDQISNAVAIVMGATSNPAPKHSRVDNTVLNISRPASPPLSASSGNNVDICALPPEADILNLIDLFFSDIGMLFPFIHKGGLLETWTTVKRNNFRSVRRSWLCLLNMILALATCISARPDLPAEMSAANADIYFKRAYALAGNMVFKSGSLETVQSLLLMTQYLQGTQRSAQTFNLLGLTVTAALRLGLHSDSASTTLTPLEKEVRKRTWYRCLMLDRMLSIIFGRPSAVLGQTLWLDEPLAYDLDIIANTSVSDLLTKTPDTPSTTCLYIYTMCVYIQFLLPTANSSRKLYEVLGNTIALLYGQNAGSAERLSISDTLQRITRLETDLMKWKRELPDELRLQPGSSPVGENEQAPIFERLSLIMKMRYLNARILLHRPVLTHLLRHIYQRDDDLEENSFLLQCSQNSLQVCVDSAVELISTIEKVGIRSYLLGAWWFSLYYTFNAALAVFAGLVIKVHTGACREDPTQASLQRSLDLAVAALQNLGNGARLAKRCRRYLEALSKVASSLTSPSVPDQLRATNTVLPDPNTAMHRAPQSSDFSNSQDTDWSPLGMDLGEFLTADNFDFMAGLVGSSQVNFDFPTQPY